MDYRTFASIKGEVQKKLDLEEELFIQADEYLDMCNKAINICEAEIHKLGIEDQYFETFGPLALNTDQFEYQLPSNIYGNKVLRVIWAKGSEIFEINRMKRKGRYIDTAVLDLYSSTRPYQYKIMNHSATGKPRLVFSGPVVDTVATYDTTATITSGSSQITVASATGLAARQFVSGTGIPSGTRIQSISGTTLTLTQEATASGTGVSVTFTDPDCTIYFIRNANKVTADTDLVDIPEFADFIVQFMVVECLKKEPALAERLKIEAMELREMRADMVAALTEMVPDQSDNIEPDYDVVEDMV